MATHDGGHQAWHAPARKRRYEVVLVGGGHALAAAYYLAKEHGVTEVAVLAPGAIGEGAAHEATVTRVADGSVAGAHFHARSLRLWETLPGQLGIDRAPRRSDVLHLAHTRAGVDALLRYGNALRLEGLDARRLDRAGVAARVPMIDLSPSARIPVLGGLFVARAFACSPATVALGYARAATALGVAVFERCTVTGLPREGNRVAGVETDGGIIAARKVGLAPDAQGAALAAMAGLRLPVEPHLLQTMLCEPATPLPESVVTSGIDRIHVGPCGEGLRIDADLGRCAPDARSASLPAIERMADVVVSLLPPLARARLLRLEASVADTATDGRPIVSATPLENVYVDCGWGQAGFGATPAAGWCLAHTIALDRPHALNAPFTLDRGGPAARPGVSPAGTATESTA